MSKPRVVVIGGGFGGIQVVKALRHSRYDVILVDKSNHHLFQPLLYQVATAALSPGDIAVPIRSVIHGIKNAQVIMDEAKSIDLKERKVMFRDGHIDYDYLVLSPGSRHSYFGRPGWEQFAPGLKSLSDALKLRERILLSFENAERLYNTEEAEKYLSFVIVGGGPTGVELAGAIAEIGRKVMLPDFPLLKPYDIKISLIEAGPALLPDFTPELSEFTARTLAALGVEVHLGMRVIDVSEEGARTADKFFKTANIIWAAGNEASSLLKSLDAPLDRAGRVHVLPDLSLPGYPDVFVIGDAAWLKDAKGVEVPGIAPAAMQEGRHAARIIQSKSAPSARPPFKYFDKGKLATIGKAKAVALFGTFGVKGLAAWLLWTFVHIFFLIDFRNRVRVIFEWMWYYITNRPGARLIVYNQESAPKKVDI